MYPYTVGPTEFVIAFFKEFVFKRTYKKSISLETDTRTQIGLQDEENQSTLLQSNVSLFQTYRYQIYTKYCFLISGRKRTFEQKWQESSGGTFRY